ncbi:hypothetical protein SAMN06296427_101579 [Moheibacter sediminis]|uniref:Uncharacterized protein n=2 Tax=Moheibacter sediminis TaxID=1434700 RepID=A0A1W1YNG9_9FLAO|nr:hypothetical protein SAMN06296427_101579 [Moheibacter sediminis]
MIISVLFILINCNFKKKFDTEFHEFVENSDSVLCDDDKLHPSYAYLKDGKLRGLEFIRNPECGRITTRYFISQSNEIEKIIFEKDFFFNNCGETFDSIYIIEPKKKSIKIFTKSTDGEFIKNDKILKQHIIDVEKYREEIINWKKVKN